MGASLIVAVFLTFSLSLSWFAGDKENGMLEETIQETMAEQEAINNQYMLLTVQMREKETAQKDLEAKLRAEEKKQKKLKRNLAMEKRKMRIAVETGKAIDVEAERERIRKEVEERASEEIAMLENKIATIEQEKKHMEESARLGLTAKRDDAGEGWNQAELARAKAKDAILKYQTLKGELDNLRAAREQADAAGREQAMARKNAEKALARVKTERAALEARLNAAEKTLIFSSAPDTEQSVKNNNAPLVAEMKKAREFLRNEIDIRNRTITKLERDAQDIERDAKLIDNNEQLTLRSALEEKARRVAELERELQNSRTREQTLRANLKNGETTAKANLDSEVERARIDTLRARIQSLQAKLRETEENKNAFAEKARARINELRKRTELLDTRNMEMEKDLQEGKPLRAKSIPSEEMAPRLMKDNRELQTKLLGDGLVDLRSKASNYVAQKMIDRNVELEAQLQETRLQLATAESAFSNARLNGYTNAIEVAPGRDDTRTIIARYRQAAIANTTLNQRNVELEARAGETTRALAQAEAARYIIEQLQIQNIELQKKLRAIDMARRADEAAFAASSTGPLDVAPSPVKAVAPLDIIGINTIENNVAPPMKAQTINVDAPAPVETQSLNKIVAVPDAVDHMAKEAAPAKSDAVALNIDEVVTLPAASMMVASLDKGLDLESAIQSIIPSASELIIKTSVVKTPAELEAERKTAATTLREIVNEIQDLNRSLEALQLGSDPDRPTLVEIHESLRNLKKKIINNVEAGTLGIEDILPYTGGEFTFYLIKEGETPDEIAGRKDVYGDPSMWPLIYKYNQSRLDRPDIITTSRLLIIYKNLPNLEKEDAIKKAQALGQWTQWKEEDKRSWIEDWIM